MSLALPVLSSQFTNIVVKAGTGIDVTPSPGPGQPAVVSLQAPQLVAEGNVVFGTTTPTPPSTSLAYQIVQFGYTTFIVLGTPDFSDWTFPANVSSDIVSLTTQGGTTIPSAYWPTTSSYVPDVPVMITVTSGGVVSAISAFVAIDTTGLIQIVGLTDDGSSYDIGDTITISLPIVITSTSIQDFDAANILLDVATIMGSSRVQQLRQIHRARNQQQQPKKKQQPAIPR